MAVARVLIDPGTGDVRASQLPNVCLHCGSPAVAPAVRRGIPARPTRKASGLEKEAAALAGALLLGPMGYAAARGAYQTKAEVFVEVPVCGACRPLAGTNVTVVSIRGNAVELDGAHEAFAVATQRMRDEEAEDFERKLLQSQDGSGAGAGGFDWSSLNG
jgi:hypothetical protein